MAVSPLRKRPSSAGSFVSPNFSDRSLLQSLLLLSKDICSLHPPLNFLLKRNRASAIRKTKLLSLIFEDLLRNHPVALVFPPSTALCLEELYILVQRIKTLLEDCLNSSTTWLLLHNHSISNSFHHITLELSTLLDVFPAAGPGKDQLNLCQDVQELVNLIRKQCLAEKEAYVDPQDEDLRIQVLHMLDTIKGEIIPDHSKLANIFERLCLCDSASCRDEMESLEDEVLNQSDPQSKADVVALIGLVRYAKCVLYGAFTPRTTPSGSSLRRRRTASSDLNIPVDFRCPISLELMQDPVVVSTGQTYDRKSITLWIESGHNTCPKTAQELANADLIPNRGLKNLIAMWCREQKIPFESSEVDVKCNGSYRVVNKAALEATKMTVSFLISTLASSSQPLEMANRVVHELRILAKTDSDSRSCIAEAGALPLLVTFLGSEQPSLQVNAVTTILNLSILEANKARIMETGVVLNGVIAVLRSGATWEAKGNAAATIFCLSGVHAYRKKLGRKTRVVKGLVELARDGPGSTKRDAMVAIMKLAEDREAVGKMIEAGVVDMVREVMGEMPEEAVRIVEVMVKRGGMKGVVGAYKVMEELGRMLREGSDGARESVAATLVNMCRKGGSEMVGAVAAIWGVERAIWEIMGMGTERGRRKAATLLRILRRWAAISGLVDGDDNGHVRMMSSDSSRGRADLYSTVNISTAPAPSSSTTRRILLPG